MNFSKNVKYYLYILLACCVVACDDSNKNDDPDKDDTGDYTDSPLTPSQNKAKLESAGKDFIAKINASDHETVLKSLNNLSEALAGSNFKEFYPEYMQREDDYEIPMQVSSLLVNTITKNDVNALMELATQGIHNQYRINDFRGIYTFNAAKHEWSKEKANNKIELHYTIGSDTSILAVNYNDIKEYTKIDGTVIEVPAKIETTLTTGKDKVLSFISNIDLSNDMYTVKINSTLTLADDYIWTILAEATPDKVSATYKQTINNEELIHGTIEVTGDDLTTPDNFGPIDPNIANNGKFDFTIMNVRLTGNGDIKAIVRGDEKIKHLDPWSSNYTEAEDKKYAETEMNLFNDYVKIEGFYVKEKQKFADIKMSINYTEEEVGRMSGKELIYITVKDWYIQPVLVFTSDETEYEFASFFTETGFSSLIGATETLVKKYQKILRNL